MENKLYQLAKAELMQLEEIKKKMNGPSKPSGYGRIEITQRGEKMYYSKIDSHGKRYIHGSDRNELKDCMQYPYDKKVDQLLNKKISSLNAFINTYDTREIKDVYTNLHPGRKPYVTPIVETNEEYLERWMSKKCIPNSYEFKSEIYSNRGEHVRSKSEKIIADWLYAHNIPYRYEKDLKLKNGEIVYPDFTLLCLKSRKEIYWEHLGMMDDPGYAEKNVRKVEKYEKNQIIPGKNLILTFETSETVLDARLIPELLKPYWE